MPGTTETIIAEKGLTLLVEKQAGDKFVEITIRIVGPADCLLHWGLSRRAGSAWEVPPQSSWPEGSEAVGKAAVHSPFLAVDGEVQITFRLDRAWKFSALNFVLFFPRENRWDNNRGRNYIVQLPQPEKKGPSPAKALENELRGIEPSFQEIAELGDGCRLAFAVWKEGGRHNAVIFSDLDGPLILHWGVAKANRSEWLAPPQSFFPPQTSIFENTAAQTPFVSVDGLNRLALKIEEAGAPLGIPFVLKQEETGKWLKKNDRHFFMPISALSQKDMGPLSGASDEIIHAETERNSWTLMHRFNLCHDLLDEARGDDGLALLFVWMRFSAIRQLTWQKNFNTKPKELSHSQERLTLKLAGVYVNADEDGREMVRLILETLGRGGEGQKIRDEILNIMHRHRIKEVSGHFMEEWHQKLHNNTTPDDVVICEAYLEFLRSNGDLSRFYRTLEAGGVTRERLRSFDRPIVTDPDFVHYIKDGLIHDFENYLRLLRSVHSGTDLETSIKMAGYLFDGEMRGLADFLFWRRNDPGLSVVEVVGKTLSARKWVRHRLKDEKDSGRTRDLLYLDLGLEEFSRMAVERAAPSRLDKDALADLVGLALESIRLSHDTRELSLVSGHWERLRKTTPRFSPDWALHAKSIMDRLGRGLGSFIDRYYRLFQSKAEYLGRAFKAEPWSVNLFTEEVARGRLPFVLSMLLRRLDPFLRKAASLGDWQIISPGGGIGRVEAVEHLKSVQGASFNGPVVIMADKVGGDEEIPREVTAVITPDSTDIVSHVAVRARNARQLFATCYDPEKFQNLKSLHGRFLRLEVNAAGDVIAKEDVEGGVPSAPVPKKITLAPFTPPEFLSYAVPMENFREGLVGGKSNTLRILRERLPESVGLPLSMALPFGVLEKVLVHPVNKDIAEKYEALLLCDGAGSTENLADIRKTISSLRPPEEVVSAIRKQMKETGLDCHKDWDKAWECVTRVWASKWNDRAYLSRKSMGIPDKDLFMAVLIQQVVEAEYAFVVHSANPFSGDKKELYAEVVLGLGETLVGNYPGRALSFVASKTDPKPRLLAFPGKSLGLYGKGLIFRSDSNGEDLAGYAGAGLYDSVLLEPPGERAMDYSGERLVWDEGFRNEFLTGVTKIGTLVEKAMGGVPQDIEGAYAKGKFHVVQTRPQAGMA